MNEIKRGEIHYAQKVNGEGAFPVLILSNDKRNEDHGFFQVANIVINPNNHNHMHVTITKTSNGTMAGSVITVDNVSSIARERINYPMPYEGRLCDEDMKRVEKALRFSLGLDQMPTMALAEPEGVQGKPQPEPEGRKFNALNRELEEIYKENRRLEVTVDILKEQYEALLDRMLKKSGT